MVLSACSTYFEQLFLEHPEPNPIVIMLETSFIDLAIIVEFMYKGEINVSQVKNQNIFIDLLTFLTRDYFVFNRISWDRC